MTVPMIASPVAATALGVNDNPAAASALAARPEGERLSKNGGNSGRQAQDRTRHRSRYTTPYRPLCAVVLGILALSASAAHAQLIDGAVMDSPIPPSIDKGRVDGVRDRPRPEYEPIGIPAGGFRLLPRIQVGTGYTDNVYGSHSNRVGDGFVTVDPTLEIRSEWSKHGLGFAAGGRFLRFFNQTSRNQDGWFVRGNGTYQITPDIDVTAEAANETAFEAQYQSDSPINALSPIRYHRTTALLRGTRTSGRTRVTLAADFENLLYDDVTLTGGAISSQSYRDLHRIRGSARVEYAFRPDAAIWVEGNVRRTDYAHDLAPGVLNRNGLEWRGLTGATLDIANLARAWVGIGYIRRSFDSPQFPTLGGFAYDARINFYVTPIDTVTLRARRSIVESATTGSGYFADQVQLRVDHELLRNVLLYGEGDYQRSSFRGVVRDDTVWQAQAGATYLLNRAMRLTGGINYLKRDSNVAGILPYNEWRGQIALTYAF